MESNRWPPEHHAPQIWIFYFLEPLKVIHNLPDIFLLLFTSLTNILKLKKKTQVKNMSATFVESVMYENCLFDHVFKYSQQFHNM